MNDQSVLRIADAVGRFGRSRVRTEMRNGRWSMPVRGVVVLHNGPLTRVQQLEVALATCPPLAALAGPSALEIDDFAGFHRDEPHIVLPEGARKPVTPGIITHWSTKLDERDIHPGREPRRTRAARSIIDFASWTDNERYARAIVLAAVQQGIIRTRDIREALTRRGNTRNRALIVESVLDAAGGIQSLPERDFDRLRTGLGLPAPTRQSPMRRADGRYYLDVEWKEFGAACEVHGIPHLRIIKWEADLERANEIVIAGPRLLIFSSYATRRQQERVGRQLVQLLRRGGWNNQR